MATRERWCSVVACAALLAAAGACSNTEPAGPGAADTSDAVFGKDTTGTKDGSTPDTVDQDTADVAGPDVVADTPGDAVPDSTGGGALGDPCATHDDCQHACVDDFGGGKVCSQPCGADGSCPPGTYCGDGPDGLGIMCLPLSKSLCAPCDADADCGSPAAGAKCVDFSGLGAFCGTSCQGGCPEGYECAAVTLLDGSTAQRCAPEGGALCECTDAAIAAGASTICEVSNAFGSCSGERVCTADGLSDCSAATPAAEACGGGDEDCDGESDEEDADGCLTYYKDADDDTFGVEGSGRCLCAPEGDHTASKAGDCDDIDGAVKGCAIYFSDPDGDGFGDPNDSQCLCAPAAPYTSQEPGCTDAGGGTVPCTTYYADVDSDGLGDDNDSACLCAPQGTYTATEGGDCSDGNGTIGGCVTYYKDGDTDGVGVESDSKCLCTPQAPHTATEFGDCDDTQAAAVPGDPEICDQIDNDCDGIVDEEGAQGCTPYYYDGDGDGYGIGAEAKCLCQPWGNYDAVQTGDCNDLDPLTFPGQPCPAPECFAFIVSGECPDGYCGAESEAKPCEGGYTCLDATSCRTSCANKSHCQPGLYCQGGACVPEKANGEACANAGQCASGYCNNGFCCADGKCCGGSDSQCGDSNPCTDDVCGPLFQCQYSNNTAQCASGNCNGLSWTAPKTCKYGACTGGGATADCSGSNPCIDYACSASGGCSNAPFSSGTQCAAAACIDFEMVQAKQCNGSGQCSQGGSSAPCPGGFACNSSGTACRTSCSSDAHCQPDTYCSNGSCVPQKDAGGSCSNDTQCYQSTCQGGYCCEGCCDWGTLGGTDFPRAMEICGVQTVSTEGIGACKRITGSFGLFDHSDQAPASGDSAMVQLSTGIPTMTAEQEYGAEQNGNSGADPDGSTGTVYDLCGFTVTLQVPTYARGLAFNFVFFSAEYPEWVGDIFNDSFNVMLTSQNYNGNISFDTNGSPISINNVLFDICNGCPNPSSQLAGTGYDGGIGGSTGWLTTTVPVVPGETITLRFVIYDEGDDIFDSDVLINNFRWLEVQPGTGPVTQ